jgi:predicted alpha/beta hydrolase
VGQLVVSTLAGVLVMGLAVAPEKVLGLAVEEMVEQVANKMTEQIVRPRKEIELGHMGLVRCLEGRTDLPEEALCC